jgi:HAD superfamily hydrolase (TIGR01509 family)
VVILSALKDATVVGRISAILFDLDGVLIDATEWHYEALNRALALFGYEISRYEHVSAYDGLPTRRKLEMLTVEKGLPAALHGLINELKQIYTREEILAHCWPVFEKEYMLSRLRREGYRIAVCSNAIRDSVQLMLDRSGLTPYLEFILSNEDVDRAKPDPAMYAKALEKLGLPADRVMAVEDAPHGIAAAKKAGLQVCQVMGFQDVDYWRIREALDAAERGS